MFGFVQALFDGVLFGATYALIGIGFTLVFGVMRLINFAYGELITAGAYVLAYTSGWPAPLAILMCMAAVVALALVQERVAFRPLRRMGASPAAMLVATFAVSFLLQAIYLLAFGTRGQIVGTLGQLNRAFTIDGVDIRWITLVTTVTGAVLLLVLFVIWRKGRPFATGNIFRASRLSSGNRLFPTQVHITPTTIVVINERNLPFILVSPAAH